MRQEFVFERLEVITDRLLQAAEKCPAAGRDTVPEGFRNNVHWHLGHILTVTDNLVYGIAGQGPKLPDTYKSHFNNGTSPADWQEEVPSWETITQQLKKQMQQIRTDFSGNLTEAVKDNFFHAESAEEVLAFAMMHTSTHAGNINAMIKLL